MAFYRTCSCCGSNLDPGERCTCQVEQQPGWKEEVPVTTIRAPNRTAAHKRPRGGCIVPAIAGRRITGTITR